MSAEAPPSMTRAVVALVLFALAFGYVEGAVVVDLRAIYEPLHQKLHPEVGPDDLFPLITLDELRKEGPEHVRRLVAELIREAATLVMLAAVPWIFSRNLRQWVAGFMIGFGIWDLVYYATLMILLGWPRSLLTWDILFLLPVPWSGPVLAPCLVSVSIIAAGLMILRREAIGRPIPIKAGHWLAIILGGLFVVISFCWDCRSVASGRMPGPFPWGVFAFGELLGLGVFGSLFMRINMKSTLARRSRAWPLLLVGGLAGLMTLVGLGRRESVVGRGTAILHDDFAFVVSGVREAPSNDKDAGARSDRGKFLIVTLNVSNRAKRVTYQFEPRKVMIVDDRGRDYHIDSFEQRRLDESNPSLSARKPPIPAGASETFDLIFSVPKDFSHPQLQITSGGPIGDFLEAVTAGSKRIDLDR